DGLWRSAPRCGHLCRGRSDAPRWRFGRRRRDPGHGRRRRQRRTAGRCDGRQPGAPVAGLSSSADNFSGSTTVLGQSLNPAGGAPGSTNRDLMTNPARFAGFSQFLGVAFAAVALFGFCWMNFTGTGHWVVVFAVVCAAILALARWKGGAVLA